MYKDILKNGDPKIAGELPSSLDRAAGISGGGRSQNLISKTRTGNLGAF